jgi:hypothetical protein
VTRVGVSRRRRRRAVSRQSRRRVSLQSGREPEAFNLQPVAEQRRSVDSQERQEYGTVRESAWHARVRWSTQLMWELPVTDDCNTDSKVGNKECERLSGVVCNPNKYRHRGTV